MAGDVSKIQSVGGYRRQRGPDGGGFGGGGGPPPVTEKTFDQYHLYTLERPTTLFDRETKQVEFAHSEGITSTAFYVYDGAKIDPSHSASAGAQTDTDYGIQCNKKVVVMREFTNSAANRLGLPLPKGKARFYRRNTDGQTDPQTVEFPISVEPDREQKVTYTVYYWG